MRGKVVPWVAAAFMAISAAAQTLKLNAEITLNGTHVSIIHDFANAVQDQCKGGN